VNEEGLREATLKTDVELRLRKANVRVLSEEEWIQDPRGPYIYISVAAADAGAPCQGLYAVNIAVQVMQSVLTSTSPAKQVTASTWHDGYSGTMGKHKLGTLRSSIADLVDEVINDYLAVNPKGGPVTTITTDPSDLLLLPSTWKSLTTGDIKVLSVFEDHILLTTLLTPTQDVAGCLSLAYLQKKDQLYTGAERFDCICTRQDTGHVGTVKRFTVAHEMELSSITPMKIEGRIMTEPDGASFDCAKETYDKPQTWRPFSWVPN